MNDKPTIQSFNLEGICKVIAATDNGLTGSEIGKLLIDCQMTDTDPGLTKWKRLYNAFAHWQNTNRSSNKILVFLCHALHPSRYIGRMELFQQRLNDLNKQLSFIGIELIGNGKFRKVEKATTLLEAEQRANSLKQKLELRKVHPDILRFCNAELLAENYFHAVFEAIKSIAERVRVMSNVHADGNALIDVAFSTSNPMVRINLLRNDTERSEHLGLANLIKGLFGLIRNPTAHTPKILFNIDEDEALDFMTTISLIHKKLDNAL